MSSLSSVPPPPSPLPLQDTEFDASEVLALWIFIHPDHVKTIDKWMQQKGLGGFTGILDTDYPLSNEDLRDLMEEHGKNGAVLTIEQRAGMWVDVDVDVGVLLLT